VLILLDCPGQTYLRRDSIVPNDLNHIKQQLDIGISADNIPQTCHEPVGDAGGCLGTGSEQQQLLQKGICQDSHKLGWQLKPLQVLDECLSIVNLLQSDRVLCCLVSFTKTPKGYGHLPPEHGKYGRSVIQLSFPLDDAQEHG